MQLFSPINLHIISLLSRNGTKIIFQQKDLHEPIKEIHQLLIIKPRSHQPTPLPWLLCYFLHVEGFFFNQKNFRFNSFFSLCYEFAWSPSLCPPSFLKSPSAVLPLYSHSHFWFKSQQCLLCSPNITSSLNSEENEVTVVTWPKFHNQIQTGPKPDSRS